MGLPVIAHAAAWTLVHADAPVTVIHDNTRYQTSAGQRLALNDIVETPAHGAAQLQDDETGNRVALAANTRVLLMHDAHIALLNGWLKATHACAGATHCLAGSIDTAQLRINLSDASTVVVAAAPPDYREVDAVFSESGMASITAFANAAKPPAPLKLNAPQFALQAVQGPSTRNEPMAIGSNADGRSTQESASTHVSPTSPTPATSASTAVAPAPSGLAVSSRPDPTFIAAMPVAFRDALPVLSSSGPIRMTPPSDARPVTYDEVSDWLTSTLPARRDPASRFVDRFRKRLSDASFRRDIKVHLHDLPEWHDLIYPPPPPPPRVIPRAVNNATTNVSSFAYPVTPFRP